MKVLFTGASSFTGCWFVQELADAGHEIAMVFRQPSETYKEMRQRRVEMARTCGEAVFSCQFGDERFIDLICANRQWDMICHHAAEVGDYRSADFDAVSALKGNTHNIKSVLEKLAERGCSKLVLTGSFFETGEGAGSDDLQAFSPYGLSKALTAQLVAYYARSQQMRLGKFVIPNPFGVYEEPRFPMYLIRNWYQGQTPSVNAPMYIRDNIHVTLLAKAYRKFVAELPGEPGFSKVNPSGYIESQGAFAQRFAVQMRSRLKLPCELELCEQVDFQEPRVRINTEPVDSAALGWNEVSAWDELADFYREVFQP